MHLVQLLLPLRDNDDRPFPRAEFDRVSRELTERFGGVTAYLRAPASGAWREEGGDVTRDDMAIVEVMADNLDRAWWNGYRHELERRFRQDEIVIRASEIERL